MIGAGDSQSPDALFEHLSVTLLQQSHLCPLPLEKQPIYWQHDHALRLYPVPDVVILADSSTPAASFTFEGCTCLNPVSTQFLLLLHVNLILTLYLLFLILQSTRQEQKGAS